MFDFFKENIFMAQVMVAMILGTILQYMFGAKKGRRIFFLIITSTIFTAILVWNLMIGMSGKSLFGFTFVIANDSPLLIVAVGFSALISMEFVALTIQFLPESMRKRVLKGLNLKDIRNEVI